MERPAPVWVDEVYTIPKYTKYCFVPECKNVSTKTPDKHFFTVPHNNKEEWCRAVGKLPVPKRALCICEDHLDLEHDLENYNSWKINKKYARLRPKVPCLKKKSKPTETTIEDGPGLSGSKESCEQRYGDQCLSKLATPIIEEEIPSRPSIERPVQQYKANEPSMRIDVNKTCEQCEESHSIAKPCSLFPRDKQMSQKLINIRSEDDWMPLDSSTVCSEHFESDMKYTASQGRSKLDTTAAVIKIKEDTNNYVEYQIMTSQMKQKSTLRLKKGILPHKFDCQKDIETQPPLTSQRFQKRILDITENALSKKSAHTRSAVSKKPTEENDCSNFQDRATEVTNKSTRLEEPMTQPGASGEYSYEATSLSDHESLDSNASETGHEAPFGIQPLDRCRFCAVFSKDSIKMTEDRPYLTKNKTKLTLNDLSLEVDFNDNALPKTVCRACDSKLLVMFDFIKQVKEAQDSLINVTDYVNEGDDIEFVNIENHTVKTECESPAPDDDDIIDSKDGILDSLTVSETVFVKPISKYKRKSVEETPKTQKKPKVIKNVEIKNEESELINIKEETAEVDAYEAESEFNETRTVNESSELELAKHALVSEYSENYMFRCISK